MKGLAHGQETLTYVQVSQCINVTDVGLKDINVLKKLKTLILFDLGSVEDVTSCMQYLKTQLPNCDIKGKQ